MHPAVHAVLAGRLERACARKRAGTSPSKARRPPPPLLAAQTSPPAAAYRGVLSASLAASQAAGADCDGRFHVPWVAHAEMEDMEYLEHLPWWAAMVAGAAAGVSEHVCMYPIDTIKTRMQASKLALQPSYASVAQAARQIVGTEGVTTIYRGVTAVVMGAIPSHALYFAVYEACKHMFGGNQEGYHPVAQGFAGCFATMAHDAVITPLDVVKQRLQLYNSTYKSVRHAVKRILAEEGAGAFYASYSTTVAMNAPFVAMHFAAYESIKQYLCQGNKAEEENSRNHVIAGAGAGALGGLVSNPLDVVKTRIQTHGAEATTDRKTKLRPVALVRHIYQTEGVSAFWRGTQARVLYFMPSAAITWTTYELCKRILKVEIDERHE